MKRRDLVIGFSSICLGGIAGCVNSATEPVDSAENTGTKARTDGGTDGSVRPAEDPAAVPREWRCTDEEFTRHPTNYEDVEWGAAAGCSLRISGTAFDYDESAKITLTNVSDETVTTGTAEDWGLEIFTDDGWKEISGKLGSDSFPETDLGADLRPNDGFEWTFELTEEEITRTTPEMIVCPDMESGRYRFVYWGIEPAVGVAFDLTHEGASGQ